MAECYNDGKGVAKNRETAEEYLDKVRDKDRGARPVYRSSSCLEMCAKIGSELVAEIEPNWDGELNEDYFEVGH